MSLASLVLLVTILISLVAILVSLIASLSLPTGTASMPGAIAAMLIPLTAVEIPHAGVGSRSISNDGGPTLALMTMRGLARCILVLSGLCHIRRGKLSNSKAQS